MITESLIFFINLLEIISFIGFVHACLKTKSQTSQLLSGKNLDVRFFFSPVPILNGYKVFESLLVYFLTLFFFCLFVFLQPHAFTSMDKDIFFLPLHLKLKSKICIRKSFFSPLDSGWSEKSVCVYPSACVCQKSSSVFCQVEVWWGLVVPCPLLKIFHSLSVSGKGGGGYYNNNNNNNKNPQLKEKLKERGWGRSPAPQQIASLHFSFVTPRRRRLPPPRRRTARRRGGSGGSRPATSPPSE